MNININDMLKSAETKFAPKSREAENKGRNSKDQGFLKSFDKALEKKGLDIKKLEEKSQKLESKEKDELEDPSEHLNINYLIQAYPVESVLNTDIDFQPLGSFLVDGGIEGLFQEESHNLDSLMTEEASLLDIKTDEETIEPLPNTDLEEASSLNFSVEEAKANLTKALDKGLNQPEIETKALQVEDVKDLEVKTQPATKEDMISKEADIKDLETVEKPIATDEKDLAPKLDQVEEPREESIDSSLDSLDTKDSLDAKDIEDTKDTALDKPIEELEEKTNIEEPKLVDSNIVFNRIQSSILASQELDEALSTQNIQKVEDSMIKFMKVSKEGDSTVMRVKLYPEELGSIDISLKLDKGKLVADIIVASDKIRDMFLNSSTALNRNLIEQNVPVKNINISVNDTFASLENTSGEAQDSDSRGNNGQGQDRRQGRGNSLNNSPIDTMRIDSINKRHIGNESLDILA